MLSHLAAVLRRRSVVEMAVAFVLGFAVLHLVDGLVQGLIISPLETRLSSTLGEFQNPLSFRIGDARFYYDTALGYLISLLVVTALAVLVLRIVDSSETEMRDCPHCLEPIARQASVCSFCTRDVPPPAIA